MISAFGGVYEPPRFRFSDCRPEPSVIADHAPSACPSQSRARPIESPPASRISRSDRKPGVAIPIADVLAEVTAAGLAAAGGSQDRVGSTRPGRACRARG